MNNIQTYGITNSIVNFKANGSKMVTKVSEKTAETLRKVAVPAAGTLAAMVGVKTVSNSKKAAEEDEMITKLKPQAIEIINKAYDEFGNLADDAAYLYEKGFENLKKYGVVEKLDDGALQIVGKTDSLNYKLISEKDDHSLLGRIEVLDKDGKIIQNITFPERNINKICTTVQVVTDEGYAVFRINENELKFKEWGCYAGLVSPGALHMLKKYAGGPYLARTAGPDGRQYWLNLS